MVFALLTGLAMVRAGAEIVFRVHEIAATVAGLRRDLPAFPLSLDPALGGDFEASLFTWIHVRFLRPVFYT